MTSVNSLGSSLTGATNNAAAAASSLTSGTAAQIQNQFLTLLVTQMKSQNPLNPMDSSQMTSQLAQISTVQGIQDLNTSIQSMLSQITALQNLDTANLVGHSALVAGSGISLGSNGGLAGYQLASPVDGGTITIRDSSGAIVQQLQLPNTAAGVSMFNWNGSTVNGTTAPAGNYTFSIDATAGGSPASVTTLTLGQIQGIDPSSSGASVLNMGPLGQKNLSDIVQLM